MKQEIILAFSGGKDSRFLLETISRFTGRALHAVFFQTPFVAPGTVESVYKFLKGNKINHTIIPVDLLSNPLIAKNERDRCYHCKNMMFQILFQTFDGSPEEVRFMEGTNFTEAVSENRPGLRAVEELGIESPLRRAGLTDDDIRTLSKAGQMVGEVDDIGCLATRIPYGIPITGKILGIIDKSEIPLRQRGLHDVRVRYLGKTAKIEVAGDSLEKLIEQPFRDWYINQLTRLGFSNIFVDIRGYQKGILDEERTGREGI